LGVIWVGVSKGQDELSCVHCDGLGIDSPYLVFSFRDVNEKVSLRVWQSQDSEKKTDCRQLFLLSLLFHILPCRHSHMSPYLSATLSTTVCRWGWCRVDIRKQFPLEKCMRVDEMEFAEARPLREELVC